MSACAKCVGSGRHLNDGGQAKLSAAMFDGDEHVCLSCAGTGLEAAPGPSRSYPDAIENPVDPPTVEGTNVTRPI